MICDFRVVIYKRLRVYAETPKWGGHRHVAGTLHWESHKSRRLWRRVSSAGVGNGREFPPPQPTSGSGECRELPSGFRVEAPAENGKRVSVLFKRQRMFLVEMFVVN